MISGSCLPTIPCYLNHRSLIAFRKLVEYFIHYFRLFFLSQYVLYYILQVVIPRQFYLCEYKCPCCLPFPQNFLFIHMFIPQYSLHVSVDNLSVVSRLFICDQRFRHSLRYRKTGITLQFSNFVFVSNENFSFLIIWLSFSEDTCASPMRLFTSVLHSVLC